MTYVTSENRHVAFRFAAPNQIGALWSDESTVSYKFYTITRGCELFSVNIFPFLQIYVF